jgi:hypothetical protein
MFISLPCIFIFAVVGYFNNCQVGQICLAFSFYAGALENGGLAAGKEGRVEVIDFEFLGSINKTKQFVLELKLYTVRFFNI